MAGSVTPRCWGKRRSGWPLWAFSVEGPWSFRFLWLLQSQGHLQARLRGIGQCCPSCYVPIGVGLPAGCPSSCRFASPWFFASNACRMRLPQDKSTSPSHGQCAHNGVSRYEGVLETGLTRGVRIQPAMGLASTFRAKHGCCRRFRSGQVSASCFALRMRVP